MPKPTPNDVSSPKDSPHQIGESAQRIGRKDSFKRRIECCDGEGEDAAPGARDGGGSTRTAK